MKTPLLLAGVIVTFLAAGGAVTADPPKLVSSSPDFWATAVNPGSQTSVSLTFDQPMRAGYWDWFGRDVLSPPSDPQTTTVSADGRTFTVGVRLQPGRVYILGLNEKGIRGVGFQNEKGLSAAPKYLVFQTAGTPAPADAPPRAVSTAPPAGAQQVDPAKTKSITVAFDKPMDSKKHGLHMTEAGKPVDLTAAKFQYSPDGRTFGLLYDFKPSTSYEVTLNSTTNIGFANTTRVPLWPVRFSFTTGQPQ